MSRLLTWCTVFAIAFGFIEGTVVVYLRLIAYPDGFHFPLEDIEPWLWWTETVREAATLTLLFAVARLAVTGGMRRFAVFAYCFGVWDLCYYVALKVCLNWPASLLDWDVLFLIPLPWTSPVLAPVLVSFALIGAALVLLREAPPIVRPLDWCVEIGAGIAILTTFFWNVPALEAGQVPSAYPWWLFLTGWLGGLAWFVLRVQPTGRKGVGPTGSSGRA
jgi:hypothetical protein